MELQVQELLERIKSEGVDAARAESDRIVAQAEEKAKNIVAQAEKAVRESEEASKARIEAMENASRLALVQASRDTFLALRQKVQLFMESAILSTTTEVLDAEFLVKFLPDLLKEMAKDIGGDLTVLLPPKTLASLDAALANRLAGELSRGVEFKPFAGIDSGFRITVEGSSLHYDFSAASVADILSSRVNARLAECVREALKGSENS